MIFDRSVKLNIRPVGQSFILSFSLRSPFFLLFFSPSNPQALVAPESLFVLYRGPFSLFSIIQSNCSTTSVVKMKPFFNSLTLAIALAASTISAPISVNLSRRALDPALVPPFGHPAGLNPTGTGDCDGITNAAGQVVKIPCFCPPNRSDFIAVCALYVFTLLLADICLVVSQSERRCRFRCQQHWHLSNVPHRRFQSL